MYYTVKKARLIDSSHIEVIFEDNTSGVIDVSTYAEPGTVFEHFSDPAYISQFHIHPETGVLTWPGDIDIAPEEIYRAAHSKSGPVSKVV